MLNNNYYCIYFITYFSFQKFNIIVYFTNISPAALLISPPYPLIGKAPSSQPHIFIPLFVVYNNMCYRYNNQCTFRPFRDTHSLRSTNVSVFVYSTNLSSSLCKSEKNVWKLERHLYHQEANPRSLCHNYSVPAHTLKYFSSKVIIDHERYITVPETKYIQ